MVNRPSLPFWIAAAFYLAVTAAVAAVAFSAIDGFAYALDDTYIHLAMARSLVESGTWGVTPFESVSASSSPAWTVLVASALAVGVPATVAPLALNVVSGLVLLAGAEKTWRAAGIAPNARSMALCVLVLIVPMPTLTLAGMEHLLHAGLAVWFLLALPGTRSIVIAFVLPLVRFESVPFVAALAAARYPSAQRRACLAGAAALVSVLLFVLISTVNGWMPLPNSVLLKSAPLEGSALGVRALRQLVAVPELAALAVGLAVIGVTRDVNRQHTRNARALLAAFVIHAQFGAFGWLYRYEAYLVAVAVVTLVASWPAWSGAGATSSYMRRGMAIAIVLLISLPLANRARNALGAGTRAPMNIYDQPLQSARFVRNFVDLEGPVVVNDLGAVSLWGERAIIDHIGLGTTAIASARLEGTYTTAMLDQLAIARQARVAVMHEDWLRPDGGVPPNWVAVGRWTIADNAICASATVTVFATSVEYAPALRRSFDQFADTLPARTTVERF